MIWSLRARNVAGIKGCNLHQAENPTPRAQQRHFVVGFTQLMQKKKKHLQAETAAESWTNEAVMGLK